jgi:hypothetical protein
LDDVYYVDTVWGEKNTVTGGIDRPSYYAQLVKLSDGTITEIQLEALARYGYDGSPDTAHTEYTTGVYSADCPWIGKLVTLSDEKWSYGNTTYNAYNAKYDLQLWSDSDYSVTVSSTDATLQLSRTDTKLIIDDKTYQLNSSTIYVLIENTQNDLDTYKVTGGLNYSNEISGAYIITRANSSLVKIILLFTDNMGVG